MFQPDYVRAIIELGERDAEAQMQEIAAFIEVSERSQRPKSQPIARSA